MSDITQINPNAAIYEMYKHSHHIHEFCKDFFDATDTKEFTFFEIRSDGSMFFFLTDLEAYERYIKDDLLVQSYDILLNDCKSVGYYLADLGVRPVLKQSSLYNISLEHEIDHYFTIIDVVRYAQGLAVRGYAFAADIKNEEINHYYMNNIRKFQRFNSYFNTYIAKLLEKLDPIPLDEKMEDKIAAYMKNFESVREINFDPQRYRRLVQYDLDYQADLSITSKELQIINSYRVFGMGSKEIAETLNISIRTVERHFENLRKKFNCRTRQQLVIQLMESGLISKKID